MQISATRHSLRISTGCMAGCGYSFRGSDVNRDTSCPRVSRPDAGRESGKGVSTTAETFARRGAGPGGPGSAGVPPLTDAAAGPMAGGRGSGSPVTTSATTGTAEDTSVFTLAMAVVADAFGASTGSGLVATDIAPRGAQLSSI